MPVTSAPSHTPFATVQALMQQSTSPPQYGRSSYSQRLFAASSSAVRRSRRTAASSPHSRSEFSVHVVAVHGCPPVCRLGAVEVEVGREERAARPLPVRVLQRQQTRAEPFGRDPRARRLPHLGRFADEIALHLPAQRRIGVEQPGDDGLSAHNANLAVACAQAGLDSPTWDGDAQRSL